jgi:putative ABC transport system substrate-binding protein
MKSGTAALLVFLALGVLVVLGAADSQQAGKVYRVGYLGSSPPPAAPWAVFKQELRKLGYLESMNLVIEERHAPVEYERLSELAAQLVRLKVDVIIALNAGQARAAQRTTSTVPIIMVIGTDPVELGLAASLGRPGGNVTGLSAQHEAVIPKMVELLKAAAPKTSRFAVLSLPGDFHTKFRRDIEAVAPTMGMTPLLVEARSIAELDSAFVAMSRQHAEGLIVLPAGEFVTHGTLIAELALKHRLPTMFAAKELLPAQGLMSYGASRTDLMRRAAHYVDRILKGEKPSDLPIEQATKFELTINLKTAKALGLTIPPSLLLRADQVIE